MPIHYNLETDVRYQQGTVRGIEIGEEKGIEKGIEIGEEKARQEEKRLFVGNLLRETDFSDEEIARIAGVTVKFVEQARRDLIAE